MHPPVRKYRSAARGIDSSAEKSRRALSASVRSVSLSLPRSRAPNPRNSRGHYRRATHRLFCRRIIVIPFFHHPRRDRFRIYRGDSRAVVEKGGYHAEARGAARTREGDGARYEGERVSERCPSLLSRSFSSSPLSPLSICLSLFLFVTMCSQGDSRDA